MLVEDAKTGTRSRAQLALAVEEPGGAGGTLVSLAEMRDLEIVEIGKRELKQVKRLLDRLSVRE